MLLSASGIFSCGRRYHGRVRDSERTALLVQEGDTASTSGNCHCAWFCSAAWLPCVFAFQDGIGLDAINDSFLLEGSIYRLLRRHCRAQPYYIHLLELFMEVVQILHAQLSTCRHSDGILKPFLFGSDIFSNRARPGSGPYDCPPWTDWPEQVHNGQVALVFCVFCTFTDLLSHIYYLFVLLRYKAIVKYKTAFYSFYLPVAAAMYIVSMTNLRGTTGAT